MNLFLILTWIFVFGLIGALLIGWTMVLVDLFKKISHKPYKNTNCNNGIQ